MADLCILSSKAPFQLSYFTSFTSAVLAVIITTGNILIISAVMRDPYKQLRTPFAFFLCNVAISDLMVGIVAMPVSAHFHYKEATQLVDIPQIMLHHLTYFVSASASLFSMAAMCFDRYYTFMSPSMHRRKLKLRHSLVIFICIWVLAGGFSSLYFFTGYVTLLVVFLNVSLVSSFGITLVTYLKILRNVQTLTKELNSMSQKDKKRSKIISRERKVTRVFVSIMITFMCIYAPALVFIYILQFCISCGCNARHVFRDLVFLLVSAGSAANSIVCIVKFTMIRKSLWVLVKCKNVMVHADSNSIFSENDEEQDKSINNLECSDIENQDGLLQESGVIKLNYANLLDNQENPPRNTQHSEQLLNEDTPANII